MTENVPEQMRAAAFKQYGNPDLLEVLMLPTPQAGPRQALVKVAYATINPADISLRDGSIAGIISGTAPYVGGLEFSGTVAATGTGSIWQPGELVAGITSFIPGGRGAHAQYVVVDDESLARVPPGLSLPLAAVIPMSGLTAQIAVDRIDARPGRSIAISGAAGAVGAFVLELASLAGAEVIAIVGADHEDRVKRAGASLVVQRGEEAAARLRASRPGGVDALVDAAVVGGKLLPAVKDGGQFIAVRPFIGEPERGIDVAYISAREYSHEPSKLARLLDLAAEGKLTPLVAHRIPPEKAADGHRMLAAGGLSGRIVLDFTG